MESPGKGQCYSLVWIQVHLRGQDQADEGSADLVVELAMAFLLAVPPGSTKRRKNADVRSSSGRWASDSSENTTRHRKDFLWPLMCPLMCPCLNPMAGSTAGKQSPQRDHLPLVWCSLDLMLDSACLTNVEQSSGYVNRERSRRMLNAAPASDGCAMLSNSTLRRVAFPARH